MADSETDEEVDVLSNTDQNGFAMYGQKSAVQQQTSHSHDHSGGWQQGKGKAGLNSRYIKRNKTRSWAAVPSLSTKQHCLWMVFVSISSRISNLFRHFIDGIIKFMLRPLHLTTFCCHLTRFLCAFSEFFSYSSKAFYDNLTRFFIVSWNQNGGTSGVRVALQITSKIL